MKWSFIITAAILLSFMDCCDGTGHVVITLTSYRNPTHRLASGGCCDRNLFGCSECDAYFKLCVADTLLGDTCNIGQKTTDVVGRRDDHRFVLKNDFPFTSFAGNIKLLVQVWDKDTLTKDDLVETVKTYITIPAVKRGNPSTNNYHTRQELIGSRVTVTVHVEVFCDKYFYGDSCNVKCIPRDDSKGHYTCDNLGTKICRRGWFGESCTRYCVPRDDPQHGHFVCDTQGNKQCLRNWQQPSCKGCVKNWFGPRCSTYCEAQDSQEQGHYKCRPADGKKHCLPWWHGTHCRSYCIPHDDNENGHYSCAHDGSKMCEHGWHGENCTAFCVPQDDDARGHYTCDTFGNKVCLDGYRPPDCKHCLLGRYGENCSLTCNNSTQEGYYDCTEAGDMKCKLWWYGPECLQYCVPHDDGMHGHYACDPRDGNKVCKAGWEGPDCILRSNN